MSRLRLTVSMIVIILALLTPATTVSHAQGAPPWLQVWLLPDRVDGPTIVEYRDGAGNTVAQYFLATDMFLWPRQAGGTLFGYDMETIAAFRPDMQAITYYPVVGLQPSTDTEWYNLTQVAPAPDGSRYAYGVMLQHSDMEQPATNWIYLGTPGSADQVLWQEDTEPFLAITPLDWGADGRTLLLHDMPQGIGGYILFWQFQDVQAVDTVTGSVIPLGNLDGYSADLRYTATLEHGESGPTALNVKEITGDVATVTHYPIPDVGEDVMVGGGAVFAPDDSKVAYQVARGMSENEKFWTIVLDLATGESRIMFEDEAADGEVRYGNIGGWLDARTLVLGSTWTDQSALVDVTTGEMIREAPGAFLGYAVGVTDATGFLPSSSTVYAQCMDAPISRLMPGITGRITFTDGTKTNVRSGPRLTEDRIAEMPEGATFTVMTGPTCADGYAWWALQFDDGTFGYVAEGTSDAYFLEPWP
jgi:hypothetical protein